jgi:hypothetical protein
MSDLSMGCGMGRRVGVECWWMSCYWGCQDDIIADYRILSMYQEVVICIFEDHVNRLVFQNHLAEGNDIFMANFPV